MRPIPIISFLAVVFPLSLLGQETFPEVYNTEPDKMAEPPSAVAALGMIELPEGFTKTLYASEPDVRNPIAMAWDRRGRMWVAENYSYAEREIRFAEDLRDRILILSDENRDGVAEGRHVFAEDLFPLTSVEVGRGGIWALCPPQLLFIPDRDEDDIPDGAPEVVLDGFTIAEANYHNLANGLRWGPDGWLYGRCGHSCPASVGVPGTPEEQRVPMEGGIWRYHPEDGAFEVLSHGTTNPWGHDWNRFGDLFFINTVNGHLWHGIHGAHFREHFGADPNPLIYERIDMHADHWHFDTTGKWSESRDGAANQFGGGHAHVGMMIYQGDQWPERFQDRLFTINMHGRRTNVERLDLEGGGYVGRHEPDIFLTDDEWFRGIDIRPGPDGAVYLLDWSDTGECHEHTGVHRTSGRIFRIAYGEGGDDDQLADLESALSGEEEALREILSDPDPWCDRMLRRELGGREEVNEATVEILRDVLASSTDVAVRLRALWTLYTVGRTSDPDLESLLNDEDEKMRSWAIRLLLDRQVIDTVIGPVKERLAGELPEQRRARFAEMGAKDPSAYVRLTLASALQRLALSDRIVIGKALASRVEDADDHNIPAMVWFGISPLVDDDPKELVEIARKNRWPVLQRWIARSLGERIEDSPAPFDLLLSGVSGSEPIIKAAILGGASDAFRGWRKVPKPSTWDAFVSALPENRTDEIATVVQELGALFGDGRALEEIKRTALDENADHNMRRAALATLIESRPEDLREICEALLDNRLLNAVAVTGLALDDDPKLGAKIADKYRRFSTEDRPAVIEILVSRPEWARTLLDRIASGKIARSDLTAFQARQIRSFEEESLTAELGRVWGDLRESDTDKRKMIEEWTAKLAPENLADADLVQGRQLYAGICGACHVMYGEGGKIGPDLTGSNRSDLGYLLENILDPSAVVSADFQMSILTMKDGRVLTGVVATESDRTLTLRQASGEMTVEKAEVAKREKSPVSMMPEGLLLAFGEDQVKNLIAYLQHPVQVPLPE